MSMDDVFKFVTLRPPKAPSKAFADRMLIKSADDSPLLVELKQAPDADAARLIARRFMGSAKYLPDAGMLNRAVDAALTKATAADAHAAATAALGTDVKTYLAQDATTQLASDLWDSVHAQVVLPDERPADRDAIYHGLRSLHYLGLLAGLNGNVRTPDKATFSRFRPLIGTGHLRGDDKRAQTADTRVEEVQSSFRELCTRIRSMHDAAGELKELGNTYRTETQRKVALQDNQIAQHGTRLLRSFHTLGLTGPLLQYGEALTGVGVRAKDAVARATTTSAVLPPRKPWIADDFGQKSLSGQTKRVLDALGLANAEREEVELVAELNRRTAVMVKDFFAATPKPLYGAIQVLPEFAWLAKTVPLGGIRLRPLFPLPDLTPTPSSRGIKPLGIGDLLVVRQELLRYTAGEVAHIENILKAETKSRRHTRVRESEEVVIEETEQLEESERDLQTTERFELQNEAQKTIESDMKVQAGLSVTASYGVVTATATGDFAFSTSSSESVKTASTYAKEVIDRSVSRILQRVREERTRRTFERFEEVNKHGFDNTDGAGHVIGIYRWVDKYYKARVINYGRRLMFEFIVPEPAAFYIHTQVGRELAGVSARKPDPPMIWGRPLQPDDLTAENYADYIADYGVQDAVPYPEPIVRVSAAFADAPGAGNEKNVNVGAASDKLKVPDGYRAIDVYGSWQTSAYDGSFFDVLIGGQDLSSANAYGVEGVIGVSVSGWVSAYQVNVVAKCELKDETVQKWQLKTYQSIVNAYQNALADYNEQVAAAQIQHGVSIQGRNPAFNRRIEQDELRKAVLRLLTNNFRSTGVGGLWYANESFNAMRDGMSYGYPEFDVDEAAKEGRIIQFFEQAFEWQNVTYRFYPYFWGRKQDWDQTFNREDVDPAFTDFLRAGSARVVVPVHPAYNEAVLYYATTNQIWNGDDPPTLNDPLFISIVEEIKADSELELGDDLPACSIDSGYPCLADEWDVKVPTSLIYLQPDSELPDFTDDEE